MPATTKLSPRTYRIVGPQKQVDERDTPHFQVRRGDWGERIRLWRQTRLRANTEADALKRTVGTEGRDMRGDPNNSFLHAVGETPEGKLNPERVPVPDPAAMARKIKEIARFFGSDVVGITHLDQAYVFSHRGRGCVAEGLNPGDPIQLTHKFAICLGQEARDDYDWYLTSNSEISDIKYQMSHRGQIAPTFMLAAYIRELGYPARAHFHMTEVNPIPLAVNAGLGELGRNGMLIHEEYGARLHLAVVTTDLPLTVDEPVDMGVEDVCRVCMKCAQTCPTYSIPFGDKVVINGVEKWAINVETCYKGRLAAQGRYINCLNCVSTCCYNKRSAWWHTLAGWMLKKTPIPLRAFYIKPLLMLDDLIWGKKPWRHMKWLDFDNAPGTATCSIPGCIAKHQPLERKPLHKIPKLKNGALPAQ